MAFVASNFMVCARMFPEGCGGSRTVGKLRTTRVGKVMAMNLHQHRSRRSEMDCTEHKSWHQQRRGMWMRRSFTAYTDNYFAAARMHSSVEVMQTLSFSTAAAERREEEEESAEHEDDRNEANAKRVYEMKLQRFAAPWPEQCSQCWHETKSCICPAEISPVACWTGTGVLLV